MNLKEMGHTALLNADKGISYFRKNGFRATWIKLRQKHYRYDEWIAMHDHLPKRDAVEKALKALPVLPVFQCTVFSSERDNPLLKKTLASLREQWYPHDRIIINGSESSEIRDDHQTTVFTMDLMAGDILSPIACYLFAKQFSQNPDAQILYGDEDRMDQHGRRHIPYFKPDWSPDTLMSWNYIGHFAAIRLDLSESIGKPEGESPEEMIYDKMLKCTESAQVICHIPQVIGHVCDEQKTSADVSGAIKRALNRRELQGDVTESRISGVYHVHYGVKGDPKVSILMPMRDHAQDTKACIESILKHTQYPDWELIILDNGSEKAETEILLTTYQRQLKERMTVLRLDMPFNYSLLNNRGAQAAAGDYLVLMNNDIELISDHWMREMLGYAQLPHIGAVGAKLYYPDHTIQHAGVMTGIAKVAAHAFIHYPGTADGQGHRLNAVCNYSAVTGALLMVKKEKYLAVGGLDEIHFAVSQNDVDFCLKLREKGWYNVFLPQAEAFHHEYKTRKKVDKISKRRFYGVEEKMIREKYPEVYEKDPFYNVNLTRCWEDFSFRGRE